MIVQPHPGSAYHRLARTARHRWWRSLLGLLVMVIGWAVAAVHLSIVVWIAAELAGRPDDADGFATFGAHADLTVTFLEVAALLPVTLFAAWWVQRRPVGSLSSVTGRLRWRWLLWCLLPAAGALTVMFGAGTAVSEATGLDTGADASWVGWSPFLLSLAMLMLVVPVQAAAEEYAFRGYLLQAVGALLRRPWIPIMVQAVLFAAIHGWGTPWGFADLVVFGALAGYLTVRTGGLEAAVALHVVNNLVAIGLAAAEGQLTIDETAADMPWQLVVVDVPVLIAYTLVVLWLAKRMRIAVVSPAGASNRLLATGIPTASAMSVSGTNASSGARRCGSSSSHEQHDGQCEQQGVDPVQQAAGAGQPGGGVLGSGSSLDHRFE